MTDREERQHVIEVLQKMVDWMQEIDDIATPERIHALFYAIASIKTDLKYDLLYEETSGHADKQADKPITQNCESCRYYGSHHKVCNYCYKCSLWTEKEPTTKNNLGVDAVSREAVNELVSSQRLDTFSDEGRKWANIKIDVILRGLKELSSVTPQEPRKGHWMGDSYGYICSNCEHSLNDLAQSMDYISFSKPKYCPNCGAKMIEPQESEDKEQTDDKDNN